MFDYKIHFCEFCKDNELELVLSFDMPTGYEAANGTFDVESKTVFINAEQLKEAPDYEKAFFLFHELRHALQYLSPERFSDAINRSIQYVIIYDGTCYKAINSKYYKCKLEGSEEFFTDVYLGQPYEVDANAFAYKRVKEIYGDSEDLRKLYEFWIPNRPVSDDLYNLIFAKIDEIINHK